MLKEGSILIFVKKMFMVLIYDFFLNFFFMFFLISKIFLHDSLFLGNLWFFEIVILFGKITCFSFKVCRIFYDSCVLVHLFLYLSSLIEFCNCLIIWICQLTTNKKLVENCSIYIALVHVQHVIVIMYLHPVTDTISRIYLLTWNYPLFMHSISVLDSQFCTCICTSILLCCTA